MNLICFLLCFVFQLILIIIQLKFLHFIKYFINWIIAIMIISLYLAPSLIPSFSFASQYFNIFSMLKSLHVFILFHVRRKKMMCVCRTWVHCKEKWCRVAYPSYVSLFTSELAINNIYRLFLEEIKIFSIHYIKPFILHKEKIKRWMRELRYSWIHMQSKGWRCFPHRCECSRWEYVCFVIAVDQIVMDGRTLPTAVQREKKNKKKEK